MDIEAVVLTGGASTRMGADKAQIPVDGVPMAERLVQQLLAMGVSVTILGREPIEGAAFVQDCEEFGGPLSALAQFRPQKPLVMVLSCDLPLFDPRVISVLDAEMEDADAAIPLIEGQLQPLCGLYRAEALMQIREVMATGRRSIFAWVKRLKVREISLENSRVAPRSVMGVNTPEELARATDHSE